MAKMPSSSVVKRREEVAVSTNWSIVRNSFRGWAGAKDQMAFLKTDAIWSGGSVVRTTRSGDSVSPWV